YLPVTRFVNEHPGVAVKARNPFAAGGIVGIEGQRDSADVQREPRRQRVHQLGYAFPPRGRDTERAGFLLLQPAAFVRRQEIALVVDLDEWHVDRLHLFEHLAHRRHLPVAVRRRGVRDVENQIRRRHFLERRAKRRDERVGQTVDE